MTEIKGSSDCGNSPKNSFVQHIAISLETNAITPSDVSDEVVWHGMTTEPLRGRSAIDRELEGRPQPTLIVVEHAISHGKVGAASGMATYENGRDRRFSHFFEFTNAKANCVASIKSYG
ncbi:hypothetical protein [Flavimaricola marinus]|uniref:Nuclear transport factor 2 family protein n=1 Tax=Flavimaricola marinus TaxID=1819565 RepID=A0A238L9M8_9RHOB|nr:hypothetical protein [Flavimaricola marinus]SMY06114.1 hypothetical protein LOM8899_00235 [Flavimaricola marinus]